MAMYDLHILTDAGISHEHALAFAKWQEQACSVLATKNDLRLLRAELKMDIAEAKTDLTRWMFAAMAGQTALIVGLIKLMLP